MATEGVMIRDGSNLTAAADLSAKQYYAVKLSASRAVNLASTGGEEIIGILQNAPASGDAADVCLFGLSKALIGTGGVTAGNAVMTEAATGKIVAYASSAVKIGIALTTQSAGELGLIFVRPLAAAV
jgi:hypothetical protein